MWKRFLFHFNRISRMDIKSNLKRQLEDQCVEDCAPLKKFASNVQQTTEPHENDDKKTVTAVYNEITYTRPSEMDVGITEYISSLPGFTATLKERYSDFIVNEIDQSQNIVHLTSLERPASQILPCKLTDIIDEDTWTKLQDLASGQDFSSEVLIDVTNMDKTSRKDIHVGLRQSFKNIESSTKDRDGKKYIIVNKCFQKGNRFNPQEGGNYCHFVLYKENRDTIAAINTIASFLRVQQKIFSYAGTKDKRAKTSQLVSAYRLPAGKLLGVNKHFQMIKVGNIEFKPEQIKLGDLSGNYFTIVLRQLNGSEENIEKGMQSLSSKGFINYFGMQRFGTSCIATHVIGRALLKGDWQQAIGLLLTPKPEDDEDLTAAKTTWNETKDAEKALEKLRHKSTIEAKLLCGISSNNKNDLVNSLNAIPRNMRMMYIHSYQSFIWNKVASKRIQKYGLQVLKGDLTSNEKNMPEANADLNKEDNRKVVLSNMVKFVSEEDIKNVSITDVLLPLPGHSVVFPDNETKQWYDDCLRSDGMSFENFKSSTKTYSLSGDYRKLVVIPENVKWQIIEYEDNTLPLALSDLDILNGTTLPDCPASGSNKALKVEFKLPSSSYATMALREVQKNS